MSQQMSTNKTREYTRFEDLDIKLRQFFLNRSSQILIEWAKQHGVSYQLTCDNCNRWTAKATYDGKVIEAHGNKKKMAALKCWKAILSQQNYVMIDSECHQIQLEMNKLKQSNDAIKQRYKTLELKYKNLSSILDTTNINANNNNYQKPQQCDEIDTKLILILFFAMIYLVIMSHTEYIIPYYYILIIAFIVFIIDQFIVYLPILIHIGMDWVRFAFQKYMDYIQENDTDKEQRESMHLKNATLLNEALLNKYDKLEHEYKDLKLKKEALNEEHRELQNKYNGLNINHISMGEKYVGLKEKYQCKTQQLEELKKKKKEYMDEENKIDSLQYKNGYLEQQCKMLEIDGNRMKNKMSMMRTSLDEMKDIEVDRNDLDDKYQELSMEYKNLTNVNKQLNDTIICLQGTMECRDNDTVITDIQCGEKCIVCYERGQLNACIPCGHLCICDECKRKYYKKKGICPRCNDKYTSMIKIYT